MPASRNVDRTWAPRSSGRIALLGFERPVVAELPPAAPLADLENCTAANIEFSDRISRGPVEHGYHRAGGTCARSGAITVKIVRAHGGCLGIWSRRRA